MNVKNVKIVAVLILGLLVIFAFMRITILKKVPDISVEDGITYLKFPKEVLSMLPEEPDWQNDENAWDAIEIARKNNSSINEFIREELKRSNSDSFKYVNANGDIFIYDEISDNTEISDSTVFFRSKNNNLVKIQRNAIINPDYYCSYQRQEYYYHTKRFLLRNTPYVSSSMPLNNSSSHYFFKNDALYYYIQVGGISKCVKVTEGGSNIDGNLKIQQSDMSYPIIEKNGNLYVYVVENAINSEFTYSVDSNDYNIIEIDLSTLEGIYEVKTMKLFDDQYLYATINDDYIISINIDPQWNDFTLNTVPLSEFMKTLMENSLIYYSDEKDMTSYIYWGKDDKNISMFNL